MPGPPRKRDAERRRRNAPAIPTESVNIAELVAQDVEIPKPDENWHDIAKMMWDSLQSSGQAIFYEPSDWMAAYLMCESISRDLEEQVVGITDSGQVVKSTIPLKGASLAAYLKMMSSLMVTEGDRRRLHVELERQKVKAAAASGDGTVVSIVKSREDLFSQARP